MLRNKSLLMREPSDFDFVCSEEEYHEWMDKNASKLSITKTYDLPEFNKKIVEGSTNCEFEIITKGKSTELLADLVYNDPNSIKTSFGFVPSLDILFTIKDAHKYKKFETARGCANYYKHAIDWHIMKNAGAEVKEEFKGFLALREKETYTHKLPNLNVSKQDFFDSSKNGVEQIYVHDDIHRAIAINDRPAYEYYLKDGSEVLTSKKKFFQCSEHIQLCGIMEESITLALERSMIVYPGVWSASQAFHFALAKVGSTICGGYFREQAFLRLFEALKQYPKDYHEKFQKCVANGTVRRISETNTSMQM